MSEENTIPYPEWTKAGWKDAREGDGLVMMRPFRARGTVQDQKCPTIMTGQGGGCGVVVKDERDYIEIPENTKRGFKEAYEGDGIKLHQQLGMSRGIVQSGKVSTLVAQDEGCGFGVVVRDPQTDAESEDVVEDDRSEVLPDMEDGDVVAMLTPGRDHKRQNGRRFKDDGTSFTLTCQDIHGIAQKSSGKLRIRYLTMRECWRLMGQPDWAYDRAVAIGTPKTHLYKQAGNSIVVDVLEAIFKGMYIDNTWEQVAPPKRVKTLDDFFGSEGGGQ